MSACIICHMQKELGMHGICLKCSIENLNTVKKFGTLEKSTAADGRIIYRPKDGTRPNP